MTAEQKAVTHTILASVRESQEGLADRTRAFFIDGPGGSGKTFTYNTLIADLTSRSLKVSNGAVSARLNCYCMFSTAVYVFFYSRSK